MIDFIILGCLYLAWYIKIILIKIKMKLYERGN